MAEMAAVAPAELPTEFVSFQRHQPSVPPPQNANLADRSLTSACHFGGNMALIATSMTF
ncbi:MAG: hypothetical protein ABI970_26660 [Chloroflexota bacterium]